MQLKMASSVTCLLAWASGVLVLLPTLVSTARLPNSFSLCRRSDPHLNTCLTKATQAAIPILSQGVRKLGVLPIDPLFVTEMNINPGEGPVNVKINYRDQSITGFRNLKVHGVRYTASGKISFVPTTGSGNNNITLVNITTLATIRGQPIYKDGEEYLEILHFDIKVGAKRMYMQFDNMFNAQIGDNMNRFLNENWEPILEEMLPGFEEALGEIFKNISNRIYLKVPFRDIHPE
ncbi:hypothetical protein C0J52_07238 [Blattella germanica]|nr:hypothetical protein C0J52_07238 [Blattella germanica]